jgi:HlyD family secretion protein
MRRLGVILLTLLAAGCAGNDDTFQGYIEGKFVDVAPEVGGRIVEFAVDRGDTVDLGGLLFRIDDTEAKAAVAEATADLARAKAELANLQQGQRPPEIAVIEAQIAEAEASRDQAEKEFARQGELFAKRVISEARLDQARETVSVAEARVAAAERQREVATLPARTGQIEAAERAVEAAQAQLEQAETRLAKHIANAPVAAVVEDTHYENGEVATAGSPVLSLLPPSRRIVVFFVPQAARPALTVGTNVSVSCDGCPAGLTARITFLGQEAEFTPPVIFSRETREKLVFRAEADLADHSAAALPLGQPVDVAPALRGTE